MFKTVGAFVQEYRPLAYIIEPVVRTSSIYTLTAKTGAGKTAFAVVAALAIVTGRSDILGMTVERGRIGYLAFENPDDVRMRLMAAAHCLGVELDELQRDFVVLDARASPETIDVELAMHAERDGPFAMIVIDTFAAAFDGRDINDNVLAGEFVRRLRPLTQLPGQPAVLIPAHPTKNAGDDGLVPYGGGAILNEVDGNLTLLAKEGTKTTLHWQGKFRGLEFQPISFRFEMVASPTILDNKGRAVVLPVLRPCSAEDTERRAEQDADVDRHILRCLACDPVPTVRDVAEQIGRGKSVMSAKLAKLSRDKLVEKVLDRWQLTPKGRRLIAVSAPGDIHD